uniref:Proteolipid protein 2-like n=1 Tax=Cyprinus carpio TaxID=7962 RepID=A0A8C2BYP8_CYPCA
MADTEGSSSGGCLEKLKSYVRTRKGRILAAEIILSLIILICYAVSKYGGYTVIAICEMVFASIFFVVFMMGMDKQFLVVNWLWSVSMNSLRLASWSSVALRTLLTVSLFVSSGSLPRCNRCSALSHNLIDLCDRGGWRRGSHRWRGETSDVQHQHMPYLFLQVLYILHGLSVN